MACSLKTSLCVSGSNVSNLRSVNKGVLQLNPSIGSLQFTESNTRDFRGKPFSIEDHKGSRDWSPKSSATFSIRAQSSFCVSRGLRWWEKTLKPNMIEMNSAQELVDSLLVAGDRLVIVDFYSTGCGGCKALHPKICQLAESNPNAIFLKVNYDELRKMCQRLHIRVLPFFRFYRGAEGRLCSFSCTNATIKKFKDAMGKHGAERCCNLGLPAKGLDESELMSLASIGEISMDLPLSSTIEELVFKNIGFSEALGKPGGVLLA